MVDIYHNTEKIYSIFLLFHEYLAVQPMKANSDN